MRALSIWQPWASLIAMGVKRFETRSWETRYRGPLLICAAKKHLSILERQRIIESDQVLWSQFMDQFIWEYEILPFGQALCVIDLREIFQTEDPQLYQFTDDKELALGDFNHGRFAFDCLRVRRFKEPWPVTGRQGLFNLPDEEIAKHELEE